MKTEDIVDTLKADMRDAADRAELAQFMKELTAVAKVLSDKHRFDSEMAAYGTAMVACTIADVTGNRQPVMCGLSDSWPDMFQEISEEDFRRMTRELAQRKRP